MNISPLSLAQKQYGSKYCLEAGPNGEPGVWTRDGGNYAFFTPLKVLEAREKELQNEIKRRDNSIEIQETPEQYYQRKINSVEWMG